MKITREQLLKIVKEEIMAETSPTFGLRTGDKVRHKDEPDRGVGRVVAKGSARDNFVLVLWADGTQQRHDPNALTKEDAVNELFGRGEKKQNVPFADNISFDWDDSGLSMVMSVDGNSVASFSSQKDVQKLISQLEELLQGPMRTSG